MPKANARNFEEENLRMGVSSILDLLMGESKEAQEIAKNKLEGGLIEYSHQNNNANTATDKASSALKKLDKESSKKKEKVDRYLTVQGLLNHPYFMSINEADIAVIIDEFERFTQSY